MLADVKLSTDLVHDLPWRLVNVEACDRVLKVARVRKTIGTERAERRKLVVRTIDFLNVYKATNTVQHPSEPKQHANKKKTHILSKDHRGKRP